MCGRTSRSATDSARTAGKRELSPPETSAEPSAERSGNRGNGRKPRLTRNLVVRTDPKFRARLARCAESNGVSESEYVRTSLLASMAADETRLANVETATA